MKWFFFVSFLTFNFFFVASQSNILLNLHDTISPHTLHKVKGERNLYKHQEPFNHSGIELFEDSTFIYYNVSDSWYDITRGKCSVKGNLICLNWDSLATIGAANNYDIYSKYFRYKSPKPFKITRLFYEKKLSSLECITIRHDRLELFYSSNDIFKKLPQIDSLVQIKYNDSEDKVIIIKEDNREIYLPNDSLWGYKIYKGCNYNYYRKVPKNSTWYFVLGIQIVQIDDLIIYFLGTEKSYPFFSKNLNSKIYPLTSSGLREAFNEQPEFAEKVIKNLEVEGFAAINQKTKTFKVIEIYRDFYKK